MNPNRFLPLLNLVGCVLITGIIVAQWYKERASDTQIKSLNQQLVSTAEHYEVEKQRTIALEHDVAQLKDSIASTVLARKESEEAMGKIIAENQAQLATIQANLDQVKIWEKALAGRDEKIKGLHSNLSATRQKLDEAIIKLKAAGAR